MFQVDTSISNARDNITGSFGPMWRITTNSHGAPYTEKFNTWLQEYMAECAARATVPQSSSSSAPRAVHTPKPGSQDLSKKLESLVVKSPKQPGFITSKVSKSRSQEKLEIVYTKKRSYASFLYIYCKAVTFMLLSIRNQSIWSRRL